MREKKESLEWILLFILMRSKELQALLITTLTGYKLDLDILS